MYDTSTEFNTNSRIIDHTMLQVFNVDLDVEPISKTRLTGAQEEPNHYISLIRRFNISNYLKNLTLQFVQAMPVYIVRQQHLI